MDSGYFIAIVVVFTILFISGFVISLISSQLQCSKINALVSLKQGAISAGVPSIVYAISAYFPGIRNDFANTLESFGVHESSSSMYGVGYLVMLAFWITTVYNIHNTQQGACVPSVDEMTAFKKKLLAELAEKQNAKVKNGQA